MTKQLILSSGGCVLDILRRGLCNSIPAENCRLLHTEVKIADLVPLTWNRKVSDESWGDQETGEAACQLLFLGDQYSQLKEERVDRCVVRRPRLHAFPGDIFVLLPYVRDFTGGAEDRVLLRRSYLRQNKVKIIHVGDKMDAGLAAVYGHLHWTTFVAPPPRDIKHLVEMNPHLTLSIYDVLRFGKTPDEAKYFQNSWMNGKMELPMKEMSYDQRYFSVDPILAFKFRSLGIEPVTYTQQGEPVSKYFGLSR